MSPQNASLKLRTLLEAEVRGVAKRGERVGLLLSGGLDSTILATILANAKIDTKCYVVEHANVKRNQDIQIAMRVAKYLSLPLTKVAVTQSTVGEALSRLERVWPYPIV
jgi:asparagine synthase (glutamine-hydrolysing)